MANKNDCYNLTNSEELRNLIKKYEQEFEDKFPNGGAEAKKNFLLKQLKDQQTEAKKNLIANNNAIAGLKDFISKAQKDYQAQGFKPLSKIRFLEYYFKDTGKHFENAGLSFWGTTQTEVNTRTKQFSSDVASVLRDKYYEVLEMNPTSEKAIALNNDIRREIARMHPKDGETIQPTNNELALQLAKVIDKHNLRGLEDMASYEIPYAKRLLENGRKGYDGLQTHDPYKLQATGDYPTDLRNWIEFVKDKVIPSQAKLLEDKKQAELIFKTLSGERKPESANKNMLSFIRSIDDDADTSFDYRRGLFFKDIESSLAYDGKYGRNGTIIQKTEAQLENFAKQINSKRQLGANPYAVLTEVQNEFQSEAGFKLKDRMRFTNEDITKWYDSTMGMQQNLSHTQQIVANTFGSIRAFGRMARFGSTALNTAGLDISTAKLAKAERLGGFDYIKQMLPTAGIEGAIKGAKMIGYVFTSKKRGLSIQEKIELNARGVGLSSIQANMQRYLVDEYLAKGVDWTQRKFNKASLMENSQNLTEKSNLDKIAYELSTELKKSFKELTPEYKTFLARYGIKEAEFNVLKHIQPEKITIGLGKKEAEMIYPVNVRQLTDEAIKPLAEKKILDIRKQKQTELGLLREIQKKEGEKTSKVDYEAKRKDIIDKFNQEEKNAIATTRLDLENKLQTAVTQLNIRTQSLRRLRNVSIGKAGTLSGEVERTVLTMKTAFVNQWQNIHESILFNPNLSKYGRYGYLIAYGASSIVTAMMAKWQLDLISGKEPREITKEFVVEALLYSNMNTVYSELANSIFGSYLGTSKNPQYTAIQNTLGFISPDVANVLKLTDGIFNVQKNPDALIQGIKSNTPFQNLWLTRALTDMTFDYLSEWAGGQGLQRRRRGISKQKNIAGEKRKYLQPIEGLRRKGE